MFDHTTPELVREASPIVREKRRTRAEATERELTGSQRAALALVVTRAVAEFREARERLESDVEAWRYYVPDWTGPEIREAIAAAHRIHPLDLDAMGDGSSFDLIHDVAGILRYLSPDGSKLGGFFLPRFAR